MIVAAGNDWQFGRLCGVLGVPELAADPRFARNSGRTANRDQLRPLLAERLKLHPAKYWFGELMAAGVRAARSTRWTRGLSWRPGSACGPSSTRVRAKTAIPTIRNPIGFSATPPRYDLPPPGLDEQGDAIRAWLANPAGE